MPNIRVGDLVSVKSPRRVHERKVGTIMAIRRTKQGVRYVVEWEPVVVEPPNPRAEYLSDEVVKTHVPWLNGSSRDE